MNFANRAIEKIGSFVKNKSFLLGTAALLTGSAAMSQTVPRLEPKHAKDTLTVHTITSPKTGKDTVVAIKPHIPTSHTQERRKKGYSAAYVGGTYTTASSLWNAGPRFSFGGTARINNFMQLEANATMRNKGMGYSYAYRNPMVNGSGSHVYIPTEIDAHIKLGHHFPIASGKSDSYDAGDVFVYAGPGGSWGVGSSTNSINYMSPEAVEGVEIMLGRIGKIERGANGKEVQKVPTVAVRLFAEMRQQYLNDYNIGAQVSNTIFPPNKTGWSNSARFGVSVAICLP